MCSTSYQRLEVVHRADAAKPRPDSTVYARIMYTNGYHVVILVPVSTVQTVLT